MTNLANANLLDENVGGNLKNERIQKTADFAQNPNMGQNEMVNNQMPPQMQQQMPPQMQQQMPPQMQQGQAKGVERTNDDEQIPNNLPVRDYGRKQVNNDADDNKILGMKPALFYTLLGVAVIAGGYFAYTKFIKKGKGSGKSLDTGSGSGSATPTPTPSITEVPIT